MGLVDLKMAAEEMDGEKITLEARLAAMANIRSIEMETPFVGHQLLCARYSSPNCMTIDTVDAESSSKLPIKYRYTTDFHFIASVLRTLPLHYSGRVRGASTPHSVAG